MLLLAFSFASSVLLAIMHPKWIFLFALVMIVLLLDIGFVILVLTPTNPNKLFAHFECCLFHFTFYC